MSLLQIDARDGTPRLFGSAQPPRATLISALTAACARNAGPVTILIHGYKYAPDAGQACPHIGLFAIHSRSRNPNVISWPRHLDTGGVILGFGWQGRGALRDVYARAEDAAQPLAALIRHVRAIAPARPVHLMCHSMGARVALGALPHLPHGAVQGVLMLAAAEYTSVAQQHLQSPAGRSAAVWHVTSGENALYDFLFERMIPAPLLGDRALGTRALAGLAPIVLDDSQTLAQLARLGHRIAPPARRICHWSPYLRGGVFSLYSSLIRGDLCPARLRQHLPATPRRRGLRLWAPLRMSTPLPIPPEPSG